MSLVNGQPLNGAPLNGTGAQDNFFFLSRDIQWDIAGQRGVLIGRVQWQITEVYTRTGTGFLGSGVSWTINPVEALGRDIQWNIYEDVFFQTCAGLNAFVWEPIVVLESRAGDRPQESGDISTMLTDTVTVEAEESVARIASFTREPRPIGPCPTETDPEFLDLTRHLGRLVTIFYTLKQTDGTVIDTYLLFTGYVDQVIYDPITRKTDYECSDARQLQLENLDRPAIDVITPGAYYSGFVFDPESDNLEYAEDRQSTVPFALDLDNTGTWRWTPWLAKLSPDFTFDECSIIYESLAIDIANYREVTTEFRIDFEYSFSRLRQRIMSFGWSYPGDFCDYLDSGHTLPQKQSIVGAANGGGWKLTSVAFENMPASQLFDCGIDGTRAWVNNGNGAAPTFCVGSSGTLTRKWQQNVNELYEIRVLAPQSASQFGTVVDDMSISMDAEYDSNEWQQEGESIKQALIERDPYIAVTTQTIATGSGLALGQAEFGEYPYVELGTNGTDRYFDANTPDIIENGEGLREEFDNAIETAIQIGKTSLLSAHRENSVTWQATLFPLVQLDHTIEINTCPVHAKGKVSAFSHEMVIGTGRATTSVTITCSKALGPPIDETPTDVPPLPDSISQMTEGQPFFGLDTRYGGQVAGSLFTFSYPGSTSPAIDTEIPFEGYTGNRSPADVGSVRYPIQFQMVTEEIGEPDRDDIEAADTTDYNVAIPNDLLELQA